MKVELAYYEISEYLRIHNNLELGLTYVSPSTINVQTDVKVPFVKKHVDANITLEKIVGNDLYLSYFISPALNWVVKQALSILRRKYPMIDVDEGNIVIHLDKISCVQRNKCTTCSSFKCTGCSGMKCTGLAAWSLGAIARCRFQLQIYDYFLILCLIDSPLSSILLALAVSLSMMASARVGSSMYSYHLPTGSCEVTMTDFLW